MRPRSLCLGASLFVAGAALTACDAPPSAPSAAAARADRQADAAVVGVFDGDSIVNLGDVYDVRKHFSFGSHEVHLSSAFDGDSIVRAGHPYDVAKHFAFSLLEGNDTVTSDAVVNLPSVQWVQYSGVAPSTAPSCTPTLDVLVLNCPASSGSGFVGYYSVMVQEASFNGIANPAFRGAFNLYVNP
jgi:hypothetical protein